MFKVGDTIKRIAGSNAYSPPGFVGVISRVEIDNADRIVYHFEEEGKWGYHIGLYGQDNASPNGNWELIKKAEEDDTPSQPLPLPEIKWALVIKSVGNDPICYAVYDSKEQAIESFNFNNARNWGYGYKIYAIIPFAEGDGLPMKEIDFKPPGEDVPF